MSEDERTLDDALKEILELYKSGGANKDSSVHAIKFLNNLNAPRIVELPAKKGKTQEQVMRELENRRKL